MEAHQHYISCYAPPMYICKAKCTRALKKVWIRTRTVTPIHRTLRYIITRVMNETELFPRSCSDSPMQELILQAWQEQRRIGWGQLFRGRLSAKWGHAQEMYYHDNPDTRGAVYYSGNLWAAQTIGQLIEMSLMLWDTRNKLLHGATLADQTKIHRERAIKIVAKKFAEGNRNIRKNSLGYIWSHAIFCVTYLLYDS